MSGIYSHTDGVEQGQALRNPNTLDFPGSPVMIGFCKPRHLQTNKLMVVGLEGCDIRRSSFHSSSQGPWLGVIFSPQVGLASDSDSSTRLISQSPRNWNASVCVLRGGPRREPSGATGCTRQVPAPRSLCERLQPSGRPTRGALAAIPQSGPLQGSEGSQAKRSTPHGPVQILSRRGTASVGPHNPTFHGNSIRCILHPDW